MIIVLYVDVPLSVELVSLAFVDVEELFLQVGRQVYGGVEILPVGRFSFNYQHLNYREIPGMVFRAGLFNYLHCVNSTCCIVIVLKRAFSKKVYGFPDNCYRDN